MCVYDDIPSAPFNGPVFLVPSESVIVRDVSSLTSTVGLTPSVPSLTSVTVTSQNPFTFPSESCASNRYRAFPSTSAALTVMLFPVASSVPSLLHTIVNLSVTSVTPSRTEAVSVVDPVLFLNVVPLSVEIIQVYVLFCSIMAFILATRSESS